MRRFFRRNALLVATVISVVLGVVVGVLVRLLNPSPEVTLLVGFPGELFLRMLKMLMLPLIVASIITGLLLYCAVFGMILSKLGQQGLVISRFFAGLNTITLQMIQLVMWYSPFGIMFLIASQVMATPNLTAMGHTLGVYMVTEISCVVFHLMVALPILYFVLTRENAFKVYAGALQALFTALATSSSSATLAVTMQSLEKKLKMDPRVCGFVLPIGATVNMDAATIYFALAPIFIAQYNGVNLSFSDIVIFSLTGLMSGVGSAAIPGSGYTVLLIILSAVGLPDRGIFLLLTIDWLTDRIRTAVNVASDCLAVGVTSRYAALPPRDLDENTMSPESAKALQEMEGSPVMPSLSSTRLNMELELDTLGVV